MNVFATYASRNENFGYSNVSYFLGKEMTELLNKRLTCEQTDRLIEALGGNARVGRAVGVTSQAVSKWRRQGLPQVRFAQIFCIFGKEPTVLAIAAEQPALLRPQTECEG